MGLFNFFSKEGKEDKAARLLQPASHVAQYVLKASNEFMMGKENPALSITTESDIQLHQTVDEDGIRSAITLQSITGKTEAPALQAQLQQLLALAEISRQLVIERNDHGKMLRIVNMEAVQEQWRHWKEHHLTALFPEESDQAKFADNFEKGLPRMDEAIPNNLNYFILLPDIYHVKKYSSPSNTGAELRLHSRLVADMPVCCRFVPMEIVEKGERAFMRLRAELQNAYEMQKKLKAYYKRPTEFSAAEYGFTIDLDYELNVANGQIIAGNLFLKEKMHDHLYYILHLQLMPAAEEKPVAPQPEERKRKRSFLADEVINEQGA
jgi:hypothetical protein